ncbi:MAG: RNA methyltransferase [Thermoanaerobaculia bacterium]|nr:RNA methyltransferase [Thermoanaerobaculia bacterium]
MKSISSRQNSWFKRVRDAIRDHEDEIVVEGPKPVADALALGWKPVMLIQRAGDDAIGEPSFQFTSEIFDSLAETRSPQNVIGLFARPTGDLGAILMDPRLVVALDGVQDPGNVGTIVRLAAAFNCAGVVLLPGSADAFAPKAIRASAGAVLNVPIAKTTARVLIESGRTMYAADARGSDAALKKNSILVFGNEGAGVSDEIRRAAKPVAIRMSERVESLNVAAAAAILLSRNYGQGGRKAAG